MEGKKNLKIQEGTGIDHWNLEPTSGHCILSLLQVELSHMTGALDFTWAGGSGECIRICTGWHSESGGALHEFARGGN
jgi:hypothetical protein